MKALSIKQPWAWAIVNGPKFLENRTWDTKFRGRFLVHAGLKVDHAGIEFCRKLHLKLPESFETGGIVGEATLVSVYQYHSSPWFQGPFAFGLAERGPLPFKPLKGRLGFFEVER